MDCHAAHHDDCEQQRMGALFMVTPAVSLGRRSHLNHSGTVSEPADTSGFPAQSLTVVDGGAFHASESRVHSNHRSVMSVAAMSGPSAGGAAGSNSRLAGDPPPAYLHIMAEDSGAFRQQMSALTSKQLPIHSATAARAARAGVTAEAVRSRSVACYHYQSMSFSPALCQSNSSVEELRWGQLQFAAAAATVFGIN